MITKLTCFGYRGFSTKQSLTLAQPNGELGSGLTVLVGPNGGGKSTIMECFSKVGTQNVSFSSGKRNKKPGDIVEIVFKEGENTYSIKTVSTGGSQNDKSGCLLSKVYYLPSQRVFEPYFGENKSERTDFEKK